MTGDRLRVQNLHFPDFHTKYPELNCLPLWSVDEDFQSLKKIKDNFFYHKLIVLSPHGLKDSEIFTKVLTKLRNL